jgi:hypothetical protein
LALRIATAYRGAPPVAPSIENIDRYEFYKFWLRRFGQQDYGRKGL